jgi:hypothetical protein
MSTRSLSARLIVLSVSKGGGGSEHFHVVIPVSSVVPA